MPFLGGFFILWIAFIVSLVLVPLAFTIFSLVEVGKAPDEAFGPPWDNGKNAWILGLALAFVIPAGTIVGPILWWSLGHRALREGRPVPRPFWSPSRPQTQHPYPYAQGQPPVPTPQHEQPPRDA
jgi:hypothetical protein